VCIGHQIRLSADLCRHSGALDDSLEYDDDLEVFVAGLEVVGIDVPQWTGVVDTVLDDDWPDEEQSALVVSFAQTQLTLVDRHHFALASHSFTYYQNTHLQRSAKQTVVGTE